MGGHDVEQVAAFFRAHPRWASPLTRAPHAAAGTAADRLAQIAPLVGKSEQEIRWLAARATAARAAAAARALPGWLARMRKKLIERTPVLAARAREDAREEWEEARPIVIRKIRTKLRGEKRQEAVA